MSASDEFIETARKCLEKSGIDVRDGFLLNIGQSSAARPHEFDLGSSSPRIIVTCRGQGWAMNGHPPTARITNWHNAMLCFANAPAGYRKIFFVVRSVHAKQTTSLAEYYVRKYGHLVPAGVEIWEYDGGKIRHLNL